MKRPNKKTLLTVLATLAVWALVGWILHSLRHSTGPTEMETSTRLLQILCAGASLLLLMTCIVVSVGLLQIARDTEAEQRFPPASAPQLKTVGNAEGEQAWMMAARLRGWAAVSMVIGMLIAGSGLAITVRAGAAVPMLPQPQLQPPLGETDHPGTIFAGSSRRETATPAA